MKNSHKLVTIAALTAITTAGLHILNNVVSTSALIKNMLPVNYGEFYNWRFGRIFYKKKGTGSPILLLHDLTPYSSSSEWSNMINDLSKSHTVYSVDLIGCGRSDKPNIEYTNFLYVQMISDFIKNVIGHKADVIATGLTSSAVVMTALHNPEVIDRIMMINPTDIVVLNQIPGKRSKLHKFFIDLPVFGTLLYHMYSSKENVELKFTEDYFYNPFNVPSEIIDTYYESAHIGKGNAKNLYSSLVGRYSYNNIVHALKNIDNSIFLIGGEQEYNIQMIAENYTYYNPAIETEYIKNTKHLPQLESPKELLDHVNVFFSREK